jgi:hypothetical protein
MEPFNGKTWIVKFTRPKEGEVERTLSDPRVEQIQMVSAPSETLTKLE